MSTEQRGPGDPNFDPMDLLEGQAPWAAERDDAQQPLQLSWRTDHEQYVLRRATRIYERAQREQQRRERRQRIAVASWAGGFLGRTAALASMLIVAGATAYGATSLLGNSSNGPARDLATSNAQIPVASGSAGPDQWSLRAWQRVGQVCVGFVVAEQEQTTCSAPPAARAVQSFTLDSPTRRYFSGLAGGRVASIRVRAGEQVQTVTTHPLASTATASRLPAGVRWFVVILQRGTSVRQPRAHVTALGANGRPLHR